MKRNPIIPPPRLDLLHTIPSWRNGNGKPDRSAFACITPKQALAWPFVRFTCQRSTLRRFDASACKKPFVPFAEQRIDFTLPAKAMHHAHDLLRPYALIGSYRTPKANANKADPFRNRPKHLGPYEDRFRAPATPYDAKFADVNAIPHWKILPLPEQWSQPLTIIRWRQNPRLRVDFFLCPACKQKCKKLFLPLCTPREFAEARSAHFWLKYLATNPQTRNSPGTKTEAQIIDRYAPLLGSPKLKCRKCCQLTYGYARFSKSARATNPPDQQQPNPNKEAAPTYTKRAPRRPNHFDKDLWNQIKHLPKQERDGIVFLYNYSKEATKVEKFRKKVCELDHQINVEHAENPPVELLSELLHLHAPHPSPPPW